MGERSQPLAEWEAVSSRDEKERQEGKKLMFGFLCLRAEDQPDNEAVSSEAKEEPGTWLAAH